MGLEPTHRRRLLGVSVVLLVAVVAGALAIAWYATLEEREQQADERAFGQIALLLLRRVEDEREARIPAVVAEFDAAVMAHIAVVPDDGEPTLSPGTPPAVGRLVATLDEPVRMQVRRRQVRIDGMLYELFGGATSQGTGAYLVRQPTPPEGAATLRPILIVGWFVTVAASALIAFAIGSRRESALRRSRERERTRTSAIAHDLRTPLASAVAAAGLLEAQMDRLPPEAQRPAAVLAGELARLRTLVEDLLELARLEAGDHAMHIEVTALADVVRDVLAARSWTEQVVTDLDDSAVAAVDRLSLSRIVLNLVDNALRHGGGRVVVHVSRRGGDAVLEVCDGGSSSNADQIQRALDGDLTERVAGGRPGLGLRIAQQNASLHGGRITVSADPVRGTTMALRLPAVAPIDPHDRATV